MIEGVSFGALLADKAFDSGALIEKVHERGAKAVISQRPQRLQPLLIDEVMYQWRHLIENFFVKIKEFKAIALRCEKTERNFRSIICIATAFIHMK